MPTFLPLPDNTYFTDKNAHGLRIFRSLNSTRIAWIS